MPLSENKYKRNGYYFKDIQILITRSIPIVGTVVLKYKVTEVILRMFNNENYTGKSILCE